MPPARPPAWPARSSRRGSACAFPSRSRRAVEKAADREGVSTNAWLVRAIARAAESRPVQRQRQAPVGLRPELGGATMQKTFEVAGPGRAGDPARLRRHQVDADADGQRRGRADRARRGVAAARRRRHGRAAASTAGRPHGDRRRAAASAASTSARSSAVRASRAASAARKASGLSASAPSRPTCSRAARSAGSTSQTASGDVEVDRVDGRRERQERERRLQRCARSAAASTSRPPPATSTSTIVRGPINVNVAPRAT